MTVTTDSGEREGEITGHLGYDKPERGGSADGNARNGEDIVLSHSRPSLNHNSVTPFT